MKVLVACEFSGVVRDAFLAKGHDAWSCDIIDTDKSGPHFKCDVLSILDKGWDLMIAHPPCTYLTIAGQVHFKNNPGRYELQKEAAAFAEKLWTADIPKICIENPVGHLPKYMGPYSQIIRMNEFGHDALKPTCLWLKGLPPLRGGKKVPVTIHTNPNGSRTSLWYSKRRTAKQRSETFLGVAKAMADQWG